MTMHPIAAVPDTSRRRRPFLLGCGGILLLLVIILTTILVTLWWVQRPITPVTLSAQEKEVVEEKLRQLTPARAPVDPTLPEVQDDRTPPREPDRPYTPGSKVLRLTEREVNGLLNENTELGKSVHIEFGRDAVNAYLAVRVPEDSPIAAGRMVKARGRFLLSIRENGEPYAILEDVTIFGISLPKAWLGDLKGENLLGDSLGGRKKIRGIKALRIVPGALELEVED